jgi:hypothetical protein
MTILNNLDQEIKKAIAYFWNTRISQTQKQLSSGKSDTGTRGAFARERGIAESCIFHTNSLELSSYFRPEKKWDLIIVDNKNLVAAIEFKSQVGPSFGNNFNNRAEEAIGSANDLWIAYREGAFSQNLRPWLGYLLVLEDHPDSRRSVKVKEPHFQIFVDFQDSSYAKRYELLIIKLIRERYYDSGCLILSPRGSLDEISEREHPIFATSNYT